MIFVKAMSTYVAASGYAFLGLDVKQVQACVDIQGKLIQQTRVGILKKNNPEGSNANLYYCQKTMSMGQGDQRN